MITILPFIKGRNLLELNLLEKTTIHGYSLFDVKYFLPFYLSDAFLLLFYQGYVSQKINGQLNKDKLSKTFKLASLCLFCLLLLVLLRSINHLFGWLTVFSSLLILKYWLIFAAPFFIEARKNLQVIYQIIAANSLFQAILVLIEQAIDGNLGIFIENSLNSNLGTATSEATDILRANGTFDEANVAAIFLLMNLAIIFPLGLKKLLMGKINVYFIISFLNLSAIIFTGSRSLYFITFAYLVFQAWRYKHNFSSLARKLWQLRIIKLLPIVFFILSGHYFLTRLESLKDTINPLGSLSYRLELNRHVWLLGQQNWLGLGIDLTPYYLAVTFKNIDSLPVIFDQAPAHNIFIQLWAETGFFGFTAFVFFVYLIYRKTLIKNDNLDSLNFVVASIIFFSASQFHPVFSNHSELTSFFFLFSGLTLKLRGANK